MGKDGFIKEIENYSINDLELIASTQQNLYNEQELEIIKERIEKLKAEYIQSRLPKEIICSKCDSPNPYSNDICDFCGVKLDKSKYEKMTFQFNESDDESDTENDMDDDDDSQSFTFNYVISFLIPLVGIIVGAIMISSEDESRRSVGKICILLGIISMAIDSIVCYVIIHSVIH